MNLGAIELYADHGIDLYGDRLEIAVCAQHCNGGVAVDAHWQSDVAGLYAAGEAAGTFGVYRPGGSALNSTQVGGLRAAEHIAGKPSEEMPMPDYRLPTIRYGSDNLDAIRLEMQSEMSRVADFDRSTDGMEQLFARVCDLCNAFFEQAVISDSSRISALFRLYDMALTQRATLSAMLASAKELGSHGSALVDRNPDRSNGKSRATRTLTQGKTSWLEPISELPSPELWFETLLAKKKQEMKHHEI